MQRSEQLNELAAALARAQAQVKGAAKDTKNTFFKSTYADLSSVWEACREALTANGLSVAQAARSTEKGVEVETMLLHASGQFLTDSLAIPVQKQDAQAFGSALTYARRYGLAAMVGVAPEDDDGNAAVAAKPKEPSQAMVDANIKPLAGVEDGLPQERKDIVQKIGNRIVDAFLAKDPDVAFAAYLDAKNVLESTEEKLMLWTLLQPNMKRTLKEMEKEHNLKTTDPVQA